MEYYSGILFLVSFIRCQTRGFLMILFKTSNRVGQIDSAFASRILFALRYELLPAEKRTELWELFSKMYRENDPRIRFDEDVRDFIKSNRVKGMNLNGREIRNGLRD